MRTPRRACKPCSQDMGLKREKEIADIASLSCDMAAVDIAEVYSPQSFTAEAEKFKPRSGFAIDLCEQKPSGGYWDMTKPEDVKLAWELLKR